MNYIFIIIFLISLTTYPVDPAHDKNNQESQINNFYTIVNDNSQKTFVEKKQSKVPCESCSGNKLVECYFALLTADQRKALAQLPAHKRKELLQNFNVQHYEKFLATFSEQEWQELWENLTETEQDYWPSSIEEQIESLELMKQKADVASDVLGFGGDIVLSAANPVFVLIPIYKIYHIIRYDENPLKASCMKAAFKEYMEGQFET